MYRPTYISVDCNRLEDNIKKIISNHRDYDYFIGVVKNNAYHHGIYIVNHLINAGINYLATSSLEEAIEVRKYNNSIPILCLEPIRIEYICDAINNGVTLTISTKDEAEQLVNADLFDTVKVHLKVDSGMNRLGIKSKQEFKNTYNILTSNKKINVEGVYTHLATNGTSDKYYDLQTSKFQQVISLVPSKNFKIIHIDRSDTLKLQGKQDFVNGARLGICMYGIENERNDSIITKIKNSIFRNSIKENKDNDLKPVLSFFSEIIQIRKAKKGEFVGYGAKYKVNKDEYIATIPCGYADGCLKMFKYVYINDKAYKIVAECMDMVMISVDNKVKIGDLVEIVGPNQSVEVLSKRLNFVEHKTLSLFSNRVPINYTYNNDTIEIKY